MGAPRSPEPGGRQAKPRSGATERPPGRLHQGFRRQLDHLANRLSSFDLELTAPRRERLLRYAALVTERAQQFNLVSKSDLPVFVEKHVGASLGPLLLVEPASNLAWIDIGSGAGLPGLVLKIWDPDQRVLLVESSGKRCLFLEEAARVLGVDVTPLQARGEDLDLTASLREAFGMDGGEAGELTRVILMRAVDPLPKALTWVPKLLTAGDLWLTFSGPRWRELLGESGSALRAGRMEFEGELEIPWSPGRILSFRKS